jgi:hypothetical protein
MSGLERLGRADVGLGRTRAHSDTGARADEICARVGDDLARLHKVIDGLRRGHDQIGLRPFLDLHRQHGSGLEADRDLVAARPLEHGDELLQDLAHGGRGNDIDFCGIESAGREHDAEAAGHGSGFRPHVSSPSCCCSELYSRPRIRPAPGPFA